MSVKNQRWVEFAIHLIFWVGLFLLISKSGQGKMIVEEMDAPDKVIDSEKLLLITYLGSAFIFYGNILVLYPRFFRKRQYAFYGVLLLIWAMLVALAEWTYLKSVLPLPLINSFYDEIVNHTVFLLFSVIYILIKVQITTNREKQLLREDQLVNELSFLKSQLNPHFLFNAINNIFSIAQKNGDDEAAQHMADLSKVMRYSLYESDDHKVLLQKELDFVKSYIQMSCLKFTPDDLTLNFSIDGEIAQQKLAPLLLVPLVENAFKHGPSPGSENSISIQIKIGPKLITASISNTFNTEKINVENQVGGIGLVNLRRRLELLYPQCHQLKTEVRKNTFTVNLEVPLDA